MLKLGDGGRVMVNQGRRHFEVLAVIGERALIEYRMPGGRDYLVEVGVDLLDAGADYRGPWINRSWGRLPRVWQDAVERGVEELKAQRQAAIDVLTVREHVDNLIARNTGFRNLRDMCEAAGRYRPSIDMRQDWGPIVADAYDKAMEARGDDRRAYRYGAR